MKLTEVLLSTHHFEEMKHFYGSLLGLDILEDQASMLTFQAGSSILGFREASPNESPYYHIAFAIPTNKFDESKAWLNERGIKLFTQDGQEEFNFEFWNATALYFYDPDDNLVEFIAHHTQGNATDEVFGSQHLLRISEIGLPVYHVPEVVSKLKASFPLDLWGGDGEQFAPLGDAEGALILVDKQRPWFPDGRIPAIFKTSVLIEGGSPIHVLVQNGMYEITAKDSILSGEANSYL